MWICCRWETVWEQDGLPWEHSAENQWEGGEAETESLILQGWKGKGQDRKPNFVPCGARIVSRWWWHETVFFRSGWKHILNTWLRECQPWG